MDTVAASAGISLMHELEKLFRRECKNFPRVNADSCLPDNLVGYAASIGITRLEAHVAPDNHASRHVAEAASVAPPPRLRRVQSPHFRFEPLPDRGEWRYVLEPRLAGP